MRPSDQFRLSLPEQLIALPILGLILFYIYAQFFQMPYIGFDLARSVINEVNVPGNLKVGDELIQFGNVTMTQFNGDWHVQLLEGLHPGDVIHLVVRRGGSETVVDWKVPGINLPEFISRLSNQWSLASIFGLFGLLTLLVVRPKDDRWRLLVAFNFLTALWLSAGCVSRWHFWASPAVLASAMWFCLPVYLHLHWNFPQPLRPISTWVWRSLYSVALVFVVATLIGLIPTIWSQLAVAIGALGALGLLAIRAFLRPTQRRETLLLVVGGLLAFLPASLLAISNALLSIKFDAINFGLLGLIAMPILYFYVAYRRQFGNFELRANRLLGAYMFFLGLGLATSIALSALQAWQNSTSLDGTLGLVLIITLAIFSTLSLRPFQAWVDKHLLGISIPPETVIEVYTQRLATSLNTQTIVSLLTDEILPSLLIRQSALFRLDENQLKPVYRAGVQEAMLPGLAELRQASITTGYYGSLQSSLSHLPWVRLILPVTIEGRSIGFWLFGHRDPDDFYSQDVIRTLQLLASQTAIALTNIAQAEQLLNLNQIHMEQYEAERVHIARELHDEVLNELSPLALADQPAASLSPDRAAQIAAKIRNVISGLRPLSLNYGLYYGLQALFDELEERHGNACALRFEVTGETVRYAPALELHLYRIIQQACDNSLKHGRPKNLKLRGELLDDQVSLIVEDDGQGFAADMTLDLANLLTNKHFGIAGMLERASIIGAAIKISPLPQGGTQIELRWPAVK